MSDTKYNSAEGPQPMTVQDASQSTVVNNVTTITYPNGTVVDGGSGVVNLSQFPAGSGFDGPSVATFNGDLVSVWCMNDTGSPVDDCYASFNMSVTGTGFVYEQSGGNAKHLNSIRRGVSTERFSRSAGFGPGSSEDFVINMWVKFDSSNSGDRDLIGWRLSAGSYSNIFLRGGGTYFEFWDSSLGGSPTSNSSTFTSIYDDAWHMITWGRRSPEGVDREYFFAVDGVDKGTYSFTGSPKDCSTEPLYIGDDPHGGYGGAPVGYIDEHQYWRGTGMYFGPNAISDLWNSGNGLFLS